MTTKTKTRLTAALVARHLAVAVVTKALPSPAEAVARDLLSDIDARRRVKDLTGRCRLVIDTGLKAGALDLVSADGNTKDTRRAVQSIEPSRSFPTNCLGNQTRSNLQPI
ncbi:hypothetical protein [Mycobacteroides abscessus]|uniref:hypothetical protein n=1 Tax=Mycobacteroides abscessus TaxID=36809 RepID=UPI0009A6AC3F|nr:hypothetical protein [Mycobacteroides abscessus]SLG33615.1 Uncharacterised protein [Mycobacteroides abscessus subsp. abscessus]